MQSRVESELDVDVFLRQGAHQLTKDRLVIVLGLEVVPWDGEKIGNPANLEQATVSANAAAPAQAPSAAAGRGGNGGQAPNRTGSAAGKPAGRNGKDMGPIFPIEGLSPYQNKSALPLGGSVEQMS